MWTSKVKRGKLHALSSCKVKSTVVDFQERFKFLSLKNDLTNFNINKLMEGTGTMAASVAMKRIMKECRDMQSKKQMFVYA